ncbi:hypothetical protein [Acinetobacter sp. SA01]|uniref:hypothetical protein n=1 Tax=Acinetobacter sp. SA01 TaxID=1862567 RepID=UPI0014080F22|nr:hypothetical protein [Acinetobacter sp. SA01]
MSLTKEQAVEKAYRGIELERELENVINPGLKRALQWMFLFLVIGIFFFPCLVVALICFAIYHFGSKKKQDLSLELQEIQATLVHEIETLEETSEVRIALAEIMAKHTSI